MTTVSETTSAKEKTALRSPRKVPKNLIWETLNGQPLYRRGYKDVMKKKRSREEIMSISLHNSLLLTYLLRTLFTKLDLTKYDVLASEIGTQLNETDQISNDLAIYNKLADSQITNRYMDIPAKIVLEIDVDVDPDSMVDLKYVMVKTQKMLDFSVEKVIWILTNIKKIMIATPDAAWITSGWSQPFEIMEGIECNIQDYLEERAVK